MLNRHGYYDFQLEEGTMDLEEAVDATAKHEATGDDVLRIALRTRNVTNYTLQQLSEYKRQFTIRWSRPTGALTESDKIFGEHRSDEDAPSLMAYGWMHPNGREIEDYVVLSVGVLRDIYDRGLLEACIDAKQRNRDWRKSTFVGNLARLRAGLLRWRGCLVSQPKPSWLDRLVKVPKSAAKRKCDGEERTTVKPKEVRHLR